MAKGPSLISRSSLLPSLPATLRDELFDEYNSIVSAYSEQRWRPSELGAGRFCEVAYTVLDGYSNSSYRAKAAKPKNMVDACRSLESRITGPRSFQILIPRLLPALYEIRNNRGVGHVGGDVDPNHMDATVTLNMTSWILAEMIRVFHGTNTSAAQQIVDSITERRAPLVWEVGGMKRILLPKLQLREQIVLLLGSSPAPVPVDELSRWLECKDRRYYLRLLRGMHAQRLVEFSQAEQTVQILPPGAAELQRIVDRETVLS